MAAFRGLIIPFLYLKTNNFNGLMESAAQTKHSVREKTAETHNTPQLRIGLATKTQDQNLTAYKVLHSQS